MPALRSRARTTHHRSQAGTGRENGRIEIGPAHLDPNPLNIGIYGDPSGDFDDLKTSISEQGILVPLVVRPLPRRDRWEILSGHRRWACAKALGLATIPCEVRDVPCEIERQQLILEYNLHRRKTFSQLMREADLLERLLVAEAEQRRFRNLNLYLKPDESPEEATSDTERRNSDARSASVPEDRPPPLESQPGRTDVKIAQRLGIGGKDLYRQARAIWKTAVEGDVRARSSVEQLDAGTKTIHAAYKDLRRRGRFTTGFRPTPYDVWSFRHDRAFGIPHPGSIPPAIVAHAVHYFSAPGALVVDPMAGGGVTPDVCQSMGRRCLAFDLSPSRPDIKQHDLQTGFPAEAAGCDLIFCDPPYHTMLGSVYQPPGVARLTLPDWMAFLSQLCRGAFAALRTGGHLALLLAAQTEKDLPAGQGYIDHAFLGYSAALEAGFAPERRISCPMSGGYQPQQVRQARVEGRLLGQVRDLLILRKPVRAETPLTSSIPHKGIRPDNTGL